MSDYVFKLPDVGEGTAEAEIAAWHVKVGDRIEEDSPLLDVMSDKAMLEITSPVSGVVVSIHAEVGARAAVGSPVVVVRLNDALPWNASKKTPPEAGETGVDEPSTQLPESASAVAAVPVTAHRATRAGKPIASPAVRERASQLGVLLEAISGSGPGGRVSQEDLDRHVAGSDAHPARPSRARRTGVEQVQVIGLRRKIAEKMQEAKRRIPHITYVEELDLTELDGLRTQLNASKRPEVPKLTLLPLLMRALVRVLPAHPEINARYDDEAGVLHRHEGVHLGIATQTPTGLLVPVVRHAEARDLWDCATEVARVADAARSGTATREEMSGSTLTITSLGALGGVSATHIINYPEVAIIGPNKLIERAIVRNGQIVVRKVMNLSSSFDHRIVDGYEAALFVQHLRGLLEDPVTWLMEDAENVG